MAGLLAVVGALALLVTGAAPAAAHATLESTSPGQGSEIDTAPASVSLHFSETVGYGPRAVEVLDAAGKRVDQGSPRHPGGDGSTVEVPLRGGLPSGSYTVIWHVVSADSHPIAGTFSFGVRVPAGAAAAVAGDEPGTSALDAVLRAAGYLGAVLLVGGVFFVQVLWPSGLSTHRGRRLITTGWLASVIAAAGLFLVQGPYGAGLGPASVLDPALLGDTISSRYGKLMLLRLVVLGFAVTMLKRRDPADAEQHGPTGWPGLDLAGLGVVFLLTFSFSEHAGQGSWVPVSVTADAIHLGAACVWVGGLAMLALAFLPPPRRGTGPADGGRPAAPDRELAQVLPLWSRIAMVAVAALVVTGTYQAWRGIGSLAALTGTTYGLLVLGKVACLAVLLVLADQGRRWVQRRAWRSGPAARVPASVGGRVAQRADAGVAPVGLPEGRAAASGPGVGRLRASVGAELAVAAVVLGLTTALVNTAPGVQAYTPPFSATVTALGTNGDSITALVDVDSTKVGATTVHLYAYTRAGAPQPFVAADGRMTQPGPESAPVRFGFADTGPGHGTAADVIVPQPGAWTLTIQIHTDATTDYAAAVRYEVR